MRKIKTYIVILSLLFLIAPRKFISDVVRFGSEGLDLFNVRSMQDDRGRMVYTIADLSYQGNRVPSITDLILSFNSPSAEMNKDDTKNYTIRYSSYSPVSGSGVLGRGGAHFYKADHRIEIDTEKNLWLGSCDDLGSFTMEFRLFPISIKDGGILFSRIGYLSGRKNGFEFIMNEQRISARLYGVFRDAAGRRIDVLLNRGGPLRSKRWYHFMLSYDRISGKLAKYINGVEEEVVYVTESEEPFNGVFVPSFSCEDIPIAVIGRDLFGYLDEFRITHRHIEDLEKETEVAYRNYKELGIIERYPVNREGVITSPVYSFPLTGTKVTLFHWDERIRKNTFIWAEFRISDDLFIERNNAIKWYRIKNDQRGIYLKKINGEYLRGRYYQWRVHLVPSPEGISSPSIYNIKLHYQLDPPPKPPLFVGAVRAGDKFVVLNWKKSVEHDILGYRIYYGLQSRRYDGIISHLEGKRITNGVNRSENYITVRITNEIIEENKNRDKRDILTYPLLKNSVLYFFSVSAYDTYKPDTKYNHESALSEEVALRPFAGSEIDN
jgi:hypothetical protein